MEKLYKLSFIWFTFACQQESMYGYKPNKLNVLVKALWYKYRIPYTLLVLLFVLIEFVYNKGILYYSVYLLFVYPLIYLMLKFLLDLGAFTWVEVVNASDYLARNFMNPHYPVEFWHNFNVNGYRAGFDWDFSTEELDALNQLAAPYLRKRPYTYSYESRLTRKVANRRWSIRAAASYRYNSSVRWVHTQAGLHKVTVYFAQTPFDLVAAINSSWRHYAPILKAESTKLLPFKNYPTQVYNSINLPHNNNFRSFLEVNTLTNFTALKEHGVCLATYNNQSLHTKAQMNPDAVLGFNGSYFEDQRNHGLDLKAVRQPGIGRSNLLSELSHDNFKGVIKNFRINAQRESVALSSEALSFLDDFPNNSSNVIDHQLLWAKYLNLFPDNYIPPMRVPSNFATNDLKPEFMDQIKQSELRIKRVSDYLYFKRISQPANNALPNEALDLFNDSYFQKLLST